MFITLPCLACQWHRLFLHVLQKRQVLEEAEMLETRISALEEDLDEVESSEDDDEEDDKVIVLL